MQKSGPVLQILLIFRLLQHHACCGQAQEESFTSACESSDPDTELTLYRACLTEAQQLFRSRIVHRLLTVSPPDHTCGDPPAQFCRLVSLTMKTFFLIPFFIIKLLKASTKHRSTYNFASDSSKLYRQTDMHISYH